MSASLVGSEMCIRDSSTTAATTSAHATTTTTLRCPTPTKRPTIQQWAVSYTHLTLPTICSV
eukprot:511238-Alexandrium_andersonii.AAC.1